MTPCSRPLIWLIATLGFGVLAPLPVHARGHVRMPETTMPILGRGPAKPVSAATVFCTERPEECRVDRSEPERIELTRSIWALILRTNDAVNGRLVAKTDQEHWGVLDRWSLPEDGYGDCEDYQLQKRHDLVAAGVPRRALRMAVVLDEFGEGHAVLVARTDRGDLVLDNKTDVVLAWEDTGYTFVKMESTDGSDWIQIEPRPAPTATAQP